MWKREPDFAPGSGTESGFRLTSGKGLLELQPSGEGEGDSGTSGSHSHEGARGNQTSSQQCCQHKTGPDGSSEPKGRCEFNRLVFGTLGRRRYVYFLDRPRGFSNIYVGGACVRACMCVCVLI